MPSLARSETASRPSRPCRPRFAAFLARPHSFADAVAFAISLGGDTDTIGSMAGALSGALLGEGAIPRLWRDRAEGARSMARVADGLFAAVTERKS